MNLRPPAAATRQRRGVLSIQPFRRLWIALALSSLGDWLSLLALTALAYQLAGRRGSGTSVEFAVSGVWISTFVPALVLGPLAGAVADRLDRRLNMIIGDVVRGLLFLSIPLFPNLTWLYIAKFLASCASLFWMPAKDASVPNLVPRDKLESANQLSLFTTYGTAPVAGLLFAVLAVISEALARVSPFFRTNQADLALYFNAATFAVSAITVFFLKQIPKREASRKIQVPSVARTIWEGWRFIWRTPVVRGLVSGMFGAFGAAGVVIGLGQIYVSRTLNGGQAGWGAVFVAVFVGLAAGLFLGPRMLQGFSRRRLFGLAITSAAVPLALMALIPNLVVVVVLTVVLGGCGGTAYITGYTLVGHEVDDEVRGRTFAFLQSSVQVILLFVTAVAPLISAGLTTLIANQLGSNTLAFGGVHFPASGEGALLLLAALVALGLGLLSYRQMDDRRGIPLGQDLMAALRGETLGPEPPAESRGLLLALEGGEGSGKTTQARLLAIWLRDQGFEVVSTHEPGATKIGMRLRALLLDKSHAGLSPYAEALMYAADRAEHISRTIRPALERGAIVVTDRYIDSSVAYQGTGRELPVNEIAQLNKWATGGLLPNLTILLDLSPSTGLARRTPSADRLESEPAEFHQRVRRGFRSLADAEPSRYLVVDATLPPGDVAKIVQERVREILPDPVPPTAEAATGSFPAIRE